jgi:DNA-binding transcriptional MerR regulator
MRRIMDRAHYMISDAAQLLAVETHVLRYWEEELSLDIPRSETGRRYYTKENIAELKRIKELKDAGYRLGAIRMIIHSDDVTGKAGKLPESTIRTEPGGERMPALMQSPAGASTGINVLAVPYVAETQRVSGVGNARPGGTDGFMEQADSLAQFTEMMTDIVGKAIAANSESIKKSISDEVSDHVIKELNYLMREREEAEEERFRELNDALRGSLKKKESGVFGWRKKKE